MKVLNPSKSAAFQPLVVEGKTVSIPEEYFHPIAAAVEKYEKISTPWILTEVRFDQPGQGIEAPPRINQFGTKKNSR
jgi:hypothetical protein